MAMHGTISHHNGAALVVRVLDADVDPVVVAVVVGDVCPRHGELHVRVQYSYARTQGETHRVLSNASNT